MAKDKGAEARLRRMGTGSDALQASQQAVATLSPAESSREAQAPEPKARLLPPTRYAQAQTIFGPANVGLIGGKDSSGRRC